MSAPPSNLVIRPVALADLDAVRAQLVATWHMTYDAIYGAALVDALTSRWHGPEALAGQVERPGTAFLLAMEEGAVVASSYAVRLSHGVVHLARLYVAPAAQGRGIGHALLEATFAALPGATRYRLEVEPKNANAIAFYRRHGFSDVGMTADCGEASGVPALVMERRAGPTG